MVIGVVRIGEGGDCAPAVVRPQEVIGKGFARGSRIQISRVEVRAHRNRVQVLAGNQVISRAANIGSVDRDVLYLLLDAEAPVDSCGGGVEAEQVVDVRRPNRAATGGVSLQRAVVRRG